MISFFSPSPPALFFFFPSDPSNIWILIPLAVPGWSQISPRARQGLLVPVLGKRCSWPCPLTGDQKDTWVTQDTQALPVHLMPKAQPVLWRTGCCGSWVPLSASSILHQEGAMKRELGCSQPALVQSLYQNSLAHEAGGDVMP